MMIWKIGLTPVGYATSRDELIEGAVAIAAPFFDSSGRVVGSLGLFGPSARLDEEVVQGYAALLREEAAQLSAALGFKNCQVPDDCARS